LLASRKELAFSYPQATLRPASCRCLFPSTSPRPEVSMMKDNDTRPVRPANVTKTPVARIAIVPAALVAPGAARPGGSADWAVTELYSLHYQMLVRLAALLVRDVPTAEDVVQDSFVAMHDGWQRLRDADSALAYLRQGAVNR